MNKKVEVNFWFYLLICILLIINSILVLKNIDKVHEYKTIIESQDETIKYQENLIRSIKIKEYKDYLKKNK